jgi:hypothetical protein
LILTLNLAKDIKTVQETTYFNLMHVRGITVLLFTVHLDKLYTAYRKQLDKLGILKFSPLFDSQQISCGTHPVYQTGTGDISPRDKMARV